MMRDTNSNDTCWLLRYCLTSRRRRSRASFMARSSARVPEILEIAEPMTAKQKMETMMSTPLSTPLAGSISGGAGVFTIQRMACKYWIQPSTPSALAISIQLCTTCSPPSSTLCLSLSSVLRPIQYHRQVRRWAQKIMAMAVLVMAMTTVTHCRPLLAALSSITVCTFVSFSMRRSRKSRRTRVTRKSRISADKLDSEVM
mmetsp:Transcript_52597/g.122704  ORF Transcript_52597/g.122704 Transcript_52597/m.122704 type:complete len:200 (+) Transcript_52597:44-643(+)